MAQFRAGARLEGRASHEFQKQGVTPGPCVVQRQALLVAVDREEPQRLAVQKRRPLTERRDPELGRGGELGLLPGDDQDLFLPVPLGPGQELADRLLHDLEVDLDQLGQVEVGVAHSRGAARPLETSAGMAIGH